MSYNKGIKTFKAGTDLEARRRVKIEGGTTNDPPEVVYAGAGEEFIGVTEYAVLDGEDIAVKLRNSGGAFEIECLVDSAIARGTVLYGGANGVVTDASSGSAQGIALETGVDNAHIQVVLWSVLSTTAATVSILDTGAFTAAATVEAALAEIYQDLLSIQRFIPIPLTSWMIGDGTNTVSCGGPATAPILDMANGDTDSALRWAWAAAAVAPIITQVPLPPDLDVSKDLVLHLLTKKDADANTVTLASDAYFMDGDTKVEDVTATIAQAFGETIITIAAADIPAGAQTVTIELTPSAHAGDALYVQGSWLEYARLILTS
jgi:hypothetical protein